MAVATNSDVQSCLMILRQELTTGISQYASQEEQYLHAKMKAENHPNITPKNEKCRTYEWDKSNSSRTFSAKGFLRDRLPIVIYNTLKECELNDMDRIMNESAGVDGITTVLFNSKSSSIKMAEFSIIEHVGEQTSQIKLHYVCIYARAECNRVLFWSTESAALEAEHRVSTLNIENKSLQCDQMLNSAVEKALQFLKEDTSQKALRL